MSARRLTIGAKIILLLWAAGLLLPVYGSWVDIHYAERQPNHQHIYFGKIDLNHHQNPDSKGVVNLPDQDATSQPVVLVCLPDEEIDVKSAEPGNLIFGLADDCPSPEDAFLPPPDHPPRI